jgi:phage tail tape-measure protein
MYLLGSLQTETSSLYLDFLARLADQQTHTTHAATMQTTQDERVKVDADEQSESLLQHPETKGLAVGGAAGAVAGAVVGGPVGAVAGGLVGQAVGGLVGAEPGSEAGAVEVVKSPEEGAGGLEGVKEQKTS